MTAVHILRMSEIFTHILLTSVIIVFIVTGYGMTNYQLLEALTGGTVSKLISFQIHSNLILPFIVLLVLHIVFPIIKKMRNR
ncbi:MAG: hypothetical protein JW840_05415 [Candidatus Thermoplasmatota archaeon]|nr:hypothetical protein [Candidatus Thermoplasmatota archaeon]